MLSFAPSVKTHQLVFILCVSSNWLLSFAKHKPRLSESSPQVSMDSDYLVGFTIASGHILYSFQGWAVVVMGV